MQEKPQELKKKDEKHGKEDESEDEPPIGVTRFREPQIYKLRFNDPEWRPAAMQSDAGDWDLILFDIMEEEMDVEFFQFRDKDNIEYGFNKMSVLCYQRIPQRLAENQQRKQSRDKMIQ